MNDSDYEHEKTGETSAHWGQRSRAKNLLALLTRDLGADVGVLTALAFPAMLLRPASLEGFHKLRFHIHRQRYAAYNLGPELKRRRNDQGLIKCDVV
jgi:hypothetical protein